MNDIDFSCGMLALTVVSLGLYGARAALRGRARHERADLDGGSVFVGKRFMEFGYWLVSPVVGLLDRAGVTPDQVTILSLVPALAAGVAAAVGWFGLACVLATVASLGDTLDGLLARRRGVASDAGEAVDAVADRYVEFFLMGGLVVYYRFSLAACLLALLALYGAFMVSYSTAKAEALQVPPPRGAMRRAERAIYLLFAAGLTPFAAALAGPDRPLGVRHAPMLAALALIAVVANVSVVLRLRAIVRALRARAHGASVPAGGARANAGGAGVSTVAASVSVTSSVRAASAVGPAGGAASGDEKARL